LGKDVQTAIKGSKTGDWSVGEDGAVTSGGIALLEGEYTLETVAHDDEGSRRATATLPFHVGGFIVLDTEVTDELAAEGLARDVVRAVQQARREAGLEVSDRIGLTVTSTPTAWEAVVAHQALIMEETLAVQFGSAGDVESLPLGEGVTEVELSGGERARIRIDTPTR